MLFDTGGGDEAANERDFKRILSLVEETKIPVLDYVIISHNHRDHVGNAVNLPNLPIRNIRQFLDHGPYTTELQLVQREPFVKYLEIRNFAKARAAVPGETFSFGAVNVHVVASSAEVITAPLPGAGAPNQLCANHVPKLDVSRGRERRSRGRRGSLRQFQLPRAQRYDLEFRAKPGLPKQPAWHRRRLPHLGAR